MNRTKAVFLCVVNCALAAYPAALAGQSMRGRVVDEPNRQGVADAHVRLLASDSSEIASTSTDAAGFFEFENTPYAGYYIDVAMPGYATSSRAVSFASGNELVIPAFVLAPMAIALDTIQATVRSERPAPPVGFSRTSYVLSGERMAVLEQHSVPVHNAVRQLGSLRVRIVRQSGRDLHCIESTRRMMSSSSSGGCENVAVVVDGVVIGDPMAFIRDTRLYDYESMEYMPPVEAGLLYGLEASANGALVLWTRGRGPHVSTDRNWRELIVAAALFANRRRPERAVPAATFLSRSPDPSPSPRLLVSRFASGVGPG